MSRPSHLPPRCPPNGRSPSVRTIDSSFHTTQAFDGLRPKHLNSPSQGSLLEKQPSWPGGLLSYPETSLKGISLQRSASDPIAIMEAAATFRNPVSPVNGVNPISTSTFDELSETVGEKEEGGFEESCVYGPNSPRQRSALTDSENSMVTALLENIPRNPFQYKCMDTPSQFNVCESAGNQGGHVGAGDDDAEKALRRRSGGQRSRVRKIQYIAELERNVITFQNRGVELAARVASQFQQQVVLSIENENLKQQFLLLCQEKIIKEGQYQSLKNEAERLKLIHGRHRRSRSAASCFEMGSFEGGVDSGIDWQISDMGKLSLGESPVSLRHGIKR